MRVVFAIDVMGQSAELGEMLQVALQSCLDNTTLTPTVIAPSFLPHFREWLDARSVHRVVASTRILGEIAEQNRLTGYPLQAAGNYLRYEAFDLIEDEVFLYCDCDVFFLSDPQFPSAPKMLAAAGADAPDDMTSVNSGVLFVNNKVMRQRIAAFLKFAGERLSDFYPGYDQPALNEFFMGSIDQLPAELNWRAYWGQNEKASVLHFHGFKCSVADQLLRGIYEGVPERLDLVVSIVSRTLENVEKLILSETFDRYADLTFMATLRKLVAKSTYICTNPLKLYLHGLVEVRATSEKAHEAQQHALRKLLSGSSELAPLRRARFSIAGATSVRLVFESPTEVLALSDLRSDSGVTLAGVPGSTRFNLSAAKLYTFAGIELHPVRPTDTGKHSEIIYNLLAPADTVELCAITTTTPLECRIYLSRGFGFTEADAFWVSIV